MGPTQRVARQPGDAGWLTRRVVAWSLYDAASSTYAALVPTFFGLFFVKVIGVELPQATSWWGLLASLTLVVAGLLAPFFGALADQRNRRLPILAASTAVCCVATIAMSRIGPGDLWFASALFIAAQVGYTLAAAVYDSLLVELARPNEVSRVSGFGWAVGLVGGIVTLCLAILVVRGNPAGSQPAMLGAIFMMGGVLMAIVGLPAIMAMRGALGRQSHSPHASARAAFSSVIRTLRNWRQNRSAFRMMLGYYLINDALYTLTFFVAIVFQKRYGLDLEGVLWLALLFHVVAAPSTYILGHWGDRWDMRRVIYVQLVILCAALVLLAFGTGDYAPIAIVALLGLVFGSIQAICRSLLAALTPGDRAAELFGFNAVAGRLSAALGPLTFGAVTAATGNEQAAVLSLILFLVAGGVAISGVRVPASRLAAGGAR
jgi:UMF1 family MFS transporter